MASRTSPSDAMAAELREIIRHAGALVDATADEADERVQKVREQLEKRLDAAKNKYADLDDLHDKPYHAVGGSFLLGLLLGWFMSRK